VARGGDRFVLRSFSPVTTIGGGVVLDPFPAPRPRLRQRRIAAEQAPAGRLAAFAAEAGLGGLDGDALAVRLGVPPARVTTVIAEAGTALLVLGDTVVARDAVGAEATRLAEVLRRYHGEHPLDPGMSLQALRAAAGGGGGGGSGVRGGGGRGGGGGGGGGRGAAAGGGARGRPGGAPGGPGGAAAGPRGGGGGGGGGRGGRPGTSGRRRRRGAGPEHPGGAVRDRGKHRPRRRLAPGARCPCQRRPGEAGAPARGGPVADPYGGRPGARAP